MNARSDAGSDLRAVVDVSVVGLDEGGRVVSWNAGAEALHGWSPHEAVGRWVQDLYEPGDASGSWAQVLSEARFRGHAEVRGWRRTRSRGWRWVDGVVSLNGEDPVAYVEVTRDVTERHALEQSELQRQQGYRALVSQVVDYAIIGLDGRGFIESWNAGAEKVKGYTEEEAVGRHFSVFYTPEDRESGLPTRLLERARREGRVEHVGWRVRKDGTRFWADVVITALRDESGRVIGFGKVTRDLSELKQLQQAQDSFYAGFEHDLRTPLTAIKGFAAMIRQRDPEGNGQLAERVEANADRLLRMAMELAAYSKLRSGRLALNLDRLELTSLAEHMVTTVASLFPGTHVEVTGEPVEVLADRVAMERVVANLLVNAMKYSQPGEPVVVTVHRGPGVGQLRVVDHGRGIAEEDLDTVFEEYERGRLARSDGGQGLGLASVKRLIELQDGSITMESKIGVGTTVTIAVPLAEAHAVQGHEGDRAV